MIERTAIFLALFALFGTACAGSAQQQAEVTRDSAMQVVKAEVVDALRRGRAGQAQEMMRDVHLVVGRYNPGRCDCPAFEVLLEGIWTRVSLEWVDAAPNADERIGELEANASAAAERGAHPIYVFTTLLTAERRTAGNDLEYGVMLVSKVDNIGAKSVSEALQITVTGVQTAAVEEPAAPPTTDEVRQPKPEDSPSDEPDDENVESDSPEVPTEPADAPD